MKIRKLKPTDPEYLFREKGPKYRIEQSRPKYILRKSITNKSVRNNTKR